MSPKTAKWAWWLPLALLLITIFSVPVLIFDEAGLPRYKRLSSDLAQIRADNAILEGEIAELKAEVDALRSDPLAIERIARDELSMVREGEIVFQFPE
ncbi:MAG: septum formation initiator family protein [Polyangiales bacterium]